MDAAVAFRHDARLLPKIGEIFKADFARRVNLESFFDELCVLAVYDNSLSERIIYISERSEAGVDTQSRFMLQPARGVRTQLANVLCRHSQLDGHHKHVVVREIASVVRLYVADHALL